MEKTLFAGLTVLDEDESITTDGGSFIGRDRRIIDRMLEIGTKTHRHTGLPGLFDPLQPIGASATGSAGTLPGDLTFSVGYTLQDADEGETLISPLTVISTPPVLERPLVAPTGVADYTTGTLLTDTYYYAISWVDGTGGETPVGPAVAVERHSGEANGRILLSGLTNGMVAAGATGWRLYRATGGGNFFRLAEGTGDTYTDDGSGSVDCDAIPVTESENSTNSDNGLLLHLPSADNRIGSASFINVYLSEDGSFSGDSFLEQFPVGSAGQDVFYSSITLENAQPPDTNNSIGGASQIDPDTELYDWHWLRPVADYAHMGSGVLGDVRMVLATGEIFGMLASAGSGINQWTELPSGGTQAEIDVTDADGPWFQSISHLSFAGSGGAGVSVSDLGNGSAQVLIGAGAGGGGGMGASALIDVTDEDGPTQADIGHLLMRGSGGVAVAVGASATGASATLALNRQRGNGSVTTASLASGASATADLTGANVGRANMCFNLQTSRVARVQVYATDADRTADLARPIGTDPVGDHGCLLDFVTISSDLSWRLSPAVMLYNMDSPPVETLYLRVTNMDATGTVQVTLRMLKMEDNT